jgi:hypothetical protein
MDCSVDWADSVFGARRVGKRRGRLYDSRVETGCDGWICLGGGGGCFSLHGWIGWHGVSWHGLNSLAIAIISVVIVFVAALPLRNLFGRFGGLVCFRAVLLFSVSCFAAR